MAYVIPTPRAAGYIIPSDEWNQNAVENPISLKALIDTNTAAIAGILIVPTEQTTTATGAQNNMDLTTRHTYLRCTGAAPVFSGFTVDGAAPQAGDTVMIDCLGTTAKVTTQDEGSTAAHRIICPSTTGQIVGVNGRMLLVYDGTTDRWRESLLDAGAPVAYTPTWVGGSPTIGNGTLTGSYVQRGNTAWVDVRMVAGSTTTFGSGTYTWSLPLTASAAERAGFAGKVLDSGTAQYICTGIALTTTALSVFAVAGQVSATVPMTWAQDDALTISGEYAIA